jgi:hypothetical protein
MAIGYDDLGTGAVNTTALTAIHTASVPVKLAELTLGNNTGVDATCVVTLGSIFYGKWTVPGNDLTRGNQIRITMNKAMGVGGVAYVTWSAASPNLTHHLSGFRLA